MYVWRSLGERQFMTHPDIFKSMCGVYSAHTTAAVLFRAANCHHVVADGEETNTSTN